jgi:tRNA-dihydrouridine synthase B
VGAVDVPVTLKIRTGSAPGYRNALRIARIAEDAGIAALAVHGRTRACAFVGAVEYETIRAVKAAVAIPVIANGDVDTPERAREVLAATGADGLMIGRAAQGRPWIFREIAHFLATGEHLPPPAVDEAHALIVEHLHDHYAFHGAEAGVRTARKHLGWYTAALEGGAAFRRTMNECETTHAQLAAVHRYFDALAERGERLADAGATFTTTTATAATDARGDRGPSRPWVGEALAA